MERHHRRPGGRRPGRPHADDPGEGDRRDGADRADQRACHTGADQHGGGVAAGLPRLIGHRRRRGWIGFDGVVCGHGTRR